MRLFSKIKSRSWFDNIDNLEQERTALINRWKAEKEAEEKRRIEEKENKINQLEQEKARLRQEYAKLKGIFATGKRWEIEEKIAHINQLIASMKE